MPKILFVEDEPSLLHVMRDKLTNQQVTYLEAKNGEEGLTTALREHPDLILLDLILPRMDGITMLEKLRQDAWGKNAHVMVLTNLTDPNAETKVKRLGVTNLFVKTDWPINVLVEKVLEKLEQKNER